MNIPTPLHHINQIYLLFTTTIAAAAATSNNNNDDDNNNNKNAHNIDKITVRQTQHKYEGVTETLYLKPFYHQS
jgi:uncharacterized membrane protein